MMTSDEVIVVEKGGYELNFFFVFVHFFFADEREFYSSLKSIISLT